MLLLSLLPDVVSIDKTDENFRLLYDVKGRFVLHRITSEEARVHFPPLPVLGIFLKPDLSSLIPLFPFPLSTSLLAWEPKEWETEEFPTLPPMMEEPSDTLTLLSRSTIQWRLTWRQERWLTSSSLTLETLPWSQVWTKALVSPCLCRFHLIHLDFGWYFPPGGRNRGRVGIVQHREKHKGSFDIVHIKDAAGNQFATRLSNVFEIGQGNKPWVSLPKGKGIKLSIVEELRKNRAAQA